MHSVAFGALISFGLKYVPAGRSIVLGYTTPLWVAPGAWRQAAIACKERLGCDYLSFVSAIDWMPAPIVGEEGSGDTSTPAQPREQTVGLAGGETRFQLLACVESTRAPFRRIVLKCDVGDDLRAESWVPVYPDRKSVV